MFKILKSSIIGSSGGFGIGIGFVKRNFSNKNIKKNTVINYEKLDLKNLPKPPIIRRSLMYVPGNDQRKIKKALNSYKTIDQIVLDCEDGVALSSKVEARKTILKTLNENCSNKDLWEKLAVRINSIESGLAKDDLNVILSGDYIPRTILIPKVDTKADMDEFYDNFHTALWSRPKNEEFKPDLNIDLITYVESAVALLDLREISFYTLKMCEFTHIDRMNVTSLEDKDRVLRAKFRYAGIVFGSDDFCADIGATRSDSGQEVLMARQQVVLIAKAMNLQAIDSVFINFRNLDELKLQSEQGASMGFTGKQCIHPDQVPIVNEAFGPTDEKITWAKGLVEEFEQAQKQGIGAFVYRGQMIDMPLLKQAYNVLNIAKQIGKA